MPICGLVVSLALPASGWAATVYLGDGALQSTAGGWDLPLQGSCPADLTKATRPDCLALRFPAYTIQADCTNAATGGANRSWSTGVCNDLVNNANQATCEAQPDRLFSNGVCAIIMKGDDRNNVTCALHGGTWITAGACVGNWIMPSRTAYTPNLLTGPASGSASPGDQCLRCHNSVTEYNGPRVRDVNWYLRMGHKNMARKVTPGTPWAGPSYACSNPLYTNRVDCEANGGTWDTALTIYPSDDSGNPFNWTNGTINVSGVDRDLTWIYGDWLSSLPRAIYKAPALTTQVCTDPRYNASNCVANGGIMVNNAGASYSCDRCHTTGWTSDATINTAKEPETSFPGITWDRNSDAPANVVNLSSGVLNDANKYSSWDRYGIVCSRCHSSAVDNTTNGGVPPFSSPAGMSSHHSVLTSPDAGSGYCSDSRFTAQAQCDAAGAAWLTACSVAGVCSNPAYTTSGSCAANGGTWTKYDTQGPCQTAGFTWFTSSCDKPGVCNNPLYTTQASCESNGAQWAAATDIIRCIDAGGRWTGSKPQRGPIIIALCMNCHRQETSGMPYANSGTGPGTPDTVNPGLNLKVGPAHNTVAFVSHPHGNQFLNSPHGKFTGTFSQIATGKFNFAMTGEYKSFFQIEAEAANTGNGCTGCHDVHKSVVEEAFEPAPGQEGAIRTECTACHAKDLNLILHPKGTGTPLEEMDIEPFEACVTCHMPDGTHLFRINVDKTYSTFPTAALTGTVNANTAPDGTFTNAVWADLDHACGQCHGGGTSQATTTGSIASGSKVLTVADTTGFLPGEKIRIADGGALTYDDEGLGRGDFDTYIVSVAGPSTINLAGAASITVGGKSVVQNATSNGAGYLTKAHLADLAKGIHNDKPFVSFSTSLGSPNTLRLNVDASQSTCSGSSANCDAYDWSWGDGTVDGSGMTASHTYLTGGSKTITLTVEQFGVSGNSLSKTVNVYVPDLPPTIAGTCTFDPNTWLETVTDASTDDNKVAQVTVNWGDGSVLTSDTTSPFGPFLHTFITAGNFTLTHKAIDSIGQQSTQTCAASPVYFIISGRVFASNGTTPVSGAYVLLKKNGSLVRGVYTSSLGTYAFGLMKPGTYTLTITKTGYTFAVPAATLTVGPNSIGNNISAISP